MVVVSTPILLSSLIDHQEQSEDIHGPEKPALVPAITKTDASNLHASTTGLPPPGLAPPPAFVSPHFYETVRNTQPPKSPQTPSSTGATRGANSSSEASKQRDNSDSSVKSMSAQNDPSEGDPAQEPARTDASTSGSFHPPHAASYQRTFPRQPFPVPPYYPGHSAPPQEQSYAPPYAQQQAPGPGFMGQYMTSQPSLTMALQSPVQFGYSHSFAHPGIHAQDPSALGIPFSSQHPPQHGRGYGYPHPPGPNPDTHTGDRGSRSGPSYVTPPSPFVDATGVRQPPASAPATSAPHMSHHAYSPIHYSQPQSSPHYTGYPAHSFAHSSPPGVYSYAPHPGTYPQSFYGQQPSSPEDASKGGTWWYLPPGGTQQYDSSAYQSGYTMAGYQQYSPQAQPGPSSPPPFAGQSNQSTRMPPVAVPPRERPHPLSPVARATASDTQREVTSPLSKKRSPLDTASASPPAASRKSYHPNPPPNRSEWVMWVGNVPSDATHDELWRFFNQPAPAHVPPPGTSAILSSRQVRPTHADYETDVWGGVASVFLISRSNCAFVNFETEQHLARAVSHFNGKPIRPKDPRCPRLVCRVRRKDDDLKAGVGGQRGMGLHTRWVAEQKERKRERERELEAQRKGWAGGGGNDSRDERDEDAESSGEGPPTSPSTYLAPSSSSDPSPPIPAVSPMDDPGPVHMPAAQQSPGAREPRHGSSGNQSFASTNSSFLATNFPKRYFILKSLTQYDLNLSLDRGIWATQPHNEGILDQAFRTSSDVYLIFGANKSGEFFGYARMTGPIFHNERVDHISWASRSSGSGRGGPEAIKEEDETDRNILSPTEHRLVDESPAPVTPGEGAGLKQTTKKGDVVSRFDAEFATAPAELLDPHKPMTRPLPPREAETLPEQRRKRTQSEGPPRAVSEGAQFFLNPKYSDPAQVQAERDSSGKAIVRADSDGVRRKDTLVTLGELRRRQGKESSQAVNVATASAAASLPMPSTTDHRAEDEKPPGEDKPEGWGREFKIQWLRTERLPFHRTRHLRNPWNHDREVKVSRDGTELEPGVGQALLEEWDKPAPEAEGTPPTSPASRGRGSRAPVRSAGGVAGVTAASTPSLSSLAHRSGPSGAVGQGRGRGAPPP